MRQQVVATNHHELPTLNTHDTTIGLDVGDRWSRYCVLDRAGTVIEEDRVRTTAAALEERFAAMASARIVLEAGSHSPWLSRQLEGYGHEVVVANARQVRLIYESDRKNDRLDAGMLARLARVDISLLAPIRHRSAEAQADLAVVRSRSVLVAARTQLINACRGLVKSVGGKIAQQFNGLLCQQRGSRHSQRDPPGTRPAVGQHPSFEDPRVRSAD